jgi:hypothetical protein
MCASYADGLRHRHSPVGAAAPAPEQQLGRGTFPPRRLAAATCTGHGPREGTGPEALLDPCPHGVKIDPDRSQRIVVGSVEQVGARPAPDEADDLGSDSFWGDTVLTQHGGRYHFFADHQRGLDRLQWPARCPVGRASHVVRPPLTWTGMALK